MKSPTDCLRRAAEKDPAGMTRVSQQECRDVLEYADKHRLHEIGERWKAKIWKEKIRKEKGK